METGDLDVNRPAQAPPSSLQKPGESGFLKSLPPRLLTSVAWSLPDLSRFCSVRERDSLQLSGSGGDGILSSAQGRWLSDKGVSTAAWWDQKSGTVPRACSLMGARSLAAILLRTGAVEPQDALNNLTYREHMSDIFWSVSQNNDQLNSRNLVHKSAVVPSRSKFKGKNIYDESVHLHVPTGDIIHLSVCRTRSDPH